MKKAIIGLVLLAGVAALGLTSCGSSDDDGDSPETQTLRIGAIIPQTGTLSSFGQPILTASHMAVAEILAAGGNVELLVRDSGTNVNIANQAARNLIDLNVDAVMGAVASGVSLGIIDTVVDSGTVMMSPANSASTFSTYDDDGLYFRTSASERLWAEATAKRINDQGLQSAVIINRDDEFGIRFTESASQDLGDSGIDVLETFQYDRDSTDFKSIASSVADLNPEAIILVSFEEGIALIQDLIEAGVAPQNTKFVLTAQTEDNLGVLIDPANPSIAEGIEDLDVAPLPEGEPTFFDRYRAFAPNAMDHPYTSFAYDAVIVLALAALQADSTDSRDIANEINAVTKDGLTCQIYRECARLIADGQNINYDGASGPLDFVDAGEPSNGAYDFLSYDSRGIRQIAGPRTCS